MTSISDPTSALWTLWASTAALVTLSILLSATYRLLESPELSNTARGQTVSTFAWSTEAVQLAITFLGPLNAVLSMRLLEPVSQIQGLAPSEAKALMCIVLAGIASLHALAVYTTHLADAFSKPDHGLEGRDLKPFMLTRAVLSSIWRACAPQVRYFVVEPAPFPPMPRGWRDRTISLATSAKSAQDQVDMTGGQPLPPQTGSGSSVTAASAPSKTKRSIVPTAAKPDCDANGLTAHSRSHHNTSSGRHVFSELSASNGRHTPTPDTKTGLAKRKTKNLSRPVADAVARLEQR
ncbi:hypothetical protein LTR85_006057 [Meristemomyces frigidus]|nr:hypothetical protein LTR85_006057 [Meristemomyces frigidus]